MKKFLITTLLLAFISPCFAAENKLIVQCENDLNSNSKGAYFSAKVLEATEFDNGILLKENDTIQGEVVNIIDAKRAKRDAYIVIKPVSYVQNGQKNEINQTGWLAKVAAYKPFDLKESATTAGVSVANFFVNGVGTVYYFGKGLLNPTDEGRIKTGAKNVYDSTLISYVEEGKPVNIRKNDLLMLVFYNQNVPSWQFWRRNK